MHGIADVLIVGAGPSGSALACLLAARGWEVLVLERARFPRPKACGECVNPGGVRVLRRLRLLNPVLRAAPARIAGWEVHGDIACAGGTTRQCPPAHIAGREIHGDGSPARGRYSAGGGGGIALSRALLDAALAAEAARRGARIEEGPRFVDLEIDRTAGLVRVLAREATGARSVRRARLVVGADGLRSAVARRAGLAGRPPRLRKLSLTCHLHGSGPPGDRGALFLADGMTFGIAPVRADARLWNGTLVVDARLHGRRVAADAIAFYRRALDALPLPWHGASPQIVGGPWASGPFDRPVRRAVAERCVLVGDAAGYYDPLTGQGIYRALRSAELAAPILDRALRAGRLAARDLAPYDRAVRRAFTPGRRVQRLIELVLARGTTRRTALRRLAAAPASMDALVRVTGDAAPVRTLLSPAAWLPLLVRRRAC